MKRISWLVLLLITVSGCSTIKNMSVQSDFEESSREYNRMLRWHDLDTAGAAFAAESIKKEYADRVQATNGVAITEYRIVYQECRPEKNEADVILQIDYYIPPSITVKTVMDKQRWVYAEENGKKMWRLVSLLPEFRK